ncbi:hypothetical protein LTS10_005249 [Elasticomyces elasticus]|nr:hypothetical protein LTS10_005249 [Elasticomyces elasticus]
MRYIQARYLNLSCMIRELSFIVVGNPTDGLPDDIVIKSYHPDNDCIDHEKHALEALTFLQGHDIPTLYGEVAVEGRRALALEHIHGVTLAKRMSDFLANRMLGVLDEDEKQWLCSLDTEIRNLLSKPSLAHVVHGDGVRPAAGVLL